MLVLILLPRTFRTVSLQPIYKMDEKTENLNRDKDYAEWRKC